MKTLELVFKTNGSATVNVNVFSPKDGVTLDEVKTAAAKLVPILITSSGAEVTAFEKANLITTSTEELA